MLAGSAPRPFYFLFLFCALRVTVLARGVQPVPALLPMVERGKRQRPLTRAARLFRDREQGKIPLRACTLLRPTGFHIIIICYRTALAHVEQAVLRLSALAKLRSGQDPFAVRTLFLQGLFLKLPSCNHCSSSLFLTVLARTSVPIQGITVLEETGDGKSAVAVDAGLFLDLLRRRGTAHLPCLQISFLHAKGTLLAVDGVSVLGASRVVEGSDRQRALAGGAGLLCGRVLRSILLVACLDLLLLGFSACLAHRAQPVLGVVALMECLGRQGALAARTGFLRGKPGAFPLLFPPQTRLAGLLPKTCFAEIQVAVLACCIAGELLKRLGLMAVRAFLYPQLVQTWFRNGSHRTMGRGARKASLCFCIG